MKDCKHEKVKYTHVMYSANSVACEWSNICEDCNKIIDFYSQTFEERPIIVGGK